MYITQNKQRGFTGIIILLIGVVLASVGIYYKTKINPDFLESKDRTGVVGNKTCTDVGCFIDSIKKCTPATFTRSTKGELLGDYFKTNFTFETISNGSSCNVEILLNSYSVAATDIAKKMAPSEKIDQIYKTANEKNKILFGKKGVCTLENNRKEFIQLLTINRDFELIMGGPGCSGDLFESISKIIEGV